MCIRDRLLIAYLVEIHTIADGLELVLHSGYRAIETNNNTPGSAKLSWHLVGGAMDFHIEGVSIQTLERLAKIAIELVNKRLGKEGFGRIFIYEGHIHIDIGRAPLA